MSKAVWNGKLIAESDRCEIVEGNVYFPPDSLRRDFLKQSATTTLCGWKGRAQYYSLVVDGQENVDAAWYYPHPTAAAASIRDHVAFWRGVKVEK